MSRWNNCCQFIFPPKNALTPILALAVSVRPFFGTHVRLFSPAFLPFAY